MDTRKWAEIDLDTAGFAYPGNALKKAWTSLHAGDLEPWPTDDDVVDGWRAFHAGDFAAAVDAAEAAGDAAYTLANKAAGIYADYLEEDDAVKQAIYQAGIDRSETAIATFPEDANAHYFHAYNLGRYSQCISVAKALSQGLGGKIRTSLERALDLAPDHGEAHTAMGLYHAEIIAKVGKLVGSMTYGANADKALEHFEEALRLAPTPIAWIEYGNGLYLLYGDKKVDESNDAYVKAAAIKPIDAMQALDVRYAAHSMG